ncbi:hypothetical protein PENTCL1PPCAC_14963, partial [Pristionchus entomophagus]
MALKDLICGEDFALSTEYIYPTFEYYGTNCYLLHAQVFGVAMVVINRFVIICTPLSKLAIWYQQVGTPTIWIVNITVPFIMMARMLFQGSVFYYREENGQIRQYIPMKIIKSNSFHGMIVSIIGSLVGAVCYVLIIRRLFTIKKNFKKVQSIKRLEMKLTMVGFSLFIALCLSTLFYIFIHVNAAHYNHGAIIALSDHYIFALMALTFVNPWMIVITHKSTRR